MSIRSKKTDFFPAIVGKEFPYFPEKIESNEEGLVAIGGTLEQPTLLEAYSKGIFPWYNYKPILWYSPKDRIVLEPKDFVLKKNLKKKLKHFRVSTNTCFEKVITSCANVVRKNEGGTWLTKEMLEAYLHLHREGFAFSVEVYKEDLLVGGLYGVNVGRGFFGESMFHLVSDASKIAVATLVLIARKHLVSFIDCQTTDANHLLSFGAKIVSRDFLNKKLLTSNAFESVEFPVLKKVVLEASDF